MRYTIFDTPVIKQIFTVLARIGLVLRGWKIKNEKLETTKFVMVAAPHTSNWDFLVMISMAFVCNLKVHWMGKQSIFKQPFSGLMKWLGGIPVDRSQANQLVTQMANHFKAASKMVLVIPPEGTRGNTKYWKTGFYHIAMQANVPIAMGFLDYAKKIGGIGPLFMPSGDLKIDEQRLRAFYQNISGRWPEKACLPNFRDTAD